MYRISARANGATPVAVPERERVTDVDAHPGRLHRSDAAGLHRQPQQPDRHDDRSRPRLRGWPRGCRRRRSWCWTGPMPNMSKASMPALALVEARQNVVMTRTFSKIYGLGGLRIGWGYGPQEIIDMLNRVRGPFNLSTAQLAAAEAAVRDTGMGRPVPRRERALARMAGRRRWPNWACRLTRRPRISSSPASPARPRRTPATTTCARRGSSCAGSRATACRSACASPWATKSACRRVVPCSGAVQGAPR